MEDKIKKSILIGTLLGDGYIPKKNRKNCSIQWEHAIKDKDYALWKADELGLKYYIYYRNRLDNRTKKTYSSIIINTASNNILNYYRKLFYPQGKKVINKTILSILTPKAIAVWYCDDGSLYISKRTGYHLYLSVDSYSKNAKNLIRRYFENKYKLNFKHTQNRLRITSKSQIKLFMRHFGKYIKLERKKYV